MTGKTIDIKSLSFRYEKKGKFLIDDINMTVPEGEIFGMLGPNGAGKTTIIHILSGLLRQYKGSIMVGRYDLQKKPMPVKRLIGVLLQSNTLDMSLSGYHNLDFFAKLLNIPNRKETILKMAKFVGLEKELHKTVEHYSGGMQRRLELARCFLKKPDILLLDEPTTGLDPIARRMIWKYLKNMNKKYGTTIILATHYTDEADFLCDRIAILDHGKIDLIDSPSNLKSKFNINLVKIKPGKSFQYTLQWLKRKKWAKDITLSNSEIKFVLFNPKKNLNDLLAFINKLESKIISFECTSLSLDDLFIRYIERHKKK